MSRMKTFFIYLLLFVGLYVVSNLLIDAYIKTSYYKIETYDIDVKEANITIMTAKASKDDGHIEGKIVNNTKQIRGERQVAKDTGKEFKIITGEKTHVSGNIPEREIIRRKDLGPQKK